MPIANKKTQIDSLIKRALRQEERYLFKIGDIVELTEASTWKDTLDKGELGRVISRSNGRYSVEWYVSGKCAWFGNEDLKLVFRRIGT